MNCFPIVQRELRIACRKKGTFLIRTIAATIAVIIGGFGCLIALAESSSRGVGKALLSILTTITVCLALASGIFLTSDCISEEKREGTLGLLFLTDLKGYDVVAGKLFSTSLRALYAILAIFPVLAVTLLMGGVSGAEFWKTTLALLNALFFSLALGMFVSSTGRDTQAVIGRTFGLLLLFNAAFPAIDRIVTFCTQGHLNLHLNLASPMFVFRRASSYAFSDYWPALIITHSLSWLFLGLAAVIVPRSWQERAKSKNGAAQSWRYAWKYGNASFRKALRLRLLDKNPVFWLSSRQRFQSWGPWIAAGALGLFFVLPIFSKWVDRSFWTFWYYLTRALMFLLYLRVATQASLFFIEARRSGSIELLLGGPLTSREIVAGQWMALRRTFAGPVLFIAILDFAATIILGGATSGSGPGHWIISFLTGGASGIALIGNSVAVAWLGMWMGVTSKSIRFASLKTVLMGIILPAALIGFMGLLIAENLAGPVEAAAGNSTGAEHTLLTRLVSSLLTIAKDVTIIAASRQWLYSSFRERASRAVAGASVNSPALALPTARVS